MKKWVVGLSVTALAGLAAWRVAKAPEANAAPATQPETARVQRVVSVGGGLTESLVALGAAEQLLAVDTSSIYPPKVVEALPKVGYQRRLSAEGILALKPELVLLGAEAGPPPVIAQLRASGLRIEQFPAVDSLPTALTRFERLGELLGRTTEAQAQIKSLQGALETLSSKLGKLQERPRMAFLYARGRGTMQVAGRGTSIEEVMRLSGGQNALRSFEGFAPLGPEGLLDADPELLLMTTRGVASLGGEAAVLKLPGIAGTQAAKQARLLALPDLALLGFGPRLAEACWQLAQALHPERVDASQLKLAALEAELGASPEAAAAR